MPASMRTSQGQVLIAKQSAVGSPATTARAALQRVEGKITNVREIGKVKIPDGNRYNRGQHWTKQIKTEFEYRVVATPEMFALLAAYHYGNSSAGVADGDGISEHVTTSAGAEFVPLTIWESVGTGSQKIIRKIEDAYIAEWKLVSAADADDPVMIEISGFASKSIYKTSLPSVTETTFSKALTWADGKALFNINGNIVAGGSSFSLTAASGLEPHFATGVEAHTTKFNSEESEISGSGAVTLDADGLAIYNEEGYGNATPADNDTMVTELMDIPMSVGFSYGADEDRRSITIDIASAIVVFENDIEFSKEGEIELPFAFFPQPTADGSEEALVLTTELAHDEAY